MSSLVASNPKAIGREEKVKLLGYWSRVHGVPSSQARDEFSSLLSGMKDDRASALFGEGWREADENFAAGAEFEAEEAVVGDLRSTLVHEGIIQESPDEGFLAGVGMDVQTSLGTVYVRLDPNGKLISAEGNLRGTQMEKDRAIASAVKKTMRYWNE